MAKYIIEYNIHIEDQVRFLKDNGMYQYGVVQDISQLPDVFVEGFEFGEYKRWRIGIDKLEFIDPDGSDKSVKVCYENNEHVEFVHGGLAGTPGYQEIKYRQINEEFQYEM